MNIVFQLTWEAVDGAVSYLVQAVNATGGTDTLGETTETSFSTLIDENADHVFLVRAYDGIYYGPALQIAYRRRRTLQDIRDMVKSELKAPPGRWQDTELDQYIREAISDYSLHFPRPQDLTVKLRGGVRDYQMPQNTVTVQRVEYITASGSTVYLKYRPWQPGESQVPSVSDIWKLGVTATSASRGRQRLGHYDYRDGRLQIDFDPSSGDLLRVRYTARYPLPSVPAAHVDVPESDHELLVLYACGKASAQVELLSANLDRWREERRRDDNPLVDPTNRYFNAYRQKLRERMSIPKFLRRTRV